MNTPVAFLVFNRPDTTRRVFETIRQARPPRLLIVADGPRPDRPDDREKCAAVRQIVETIDWPCEVQRNYADTNMGCKMRVSSGLDWVFSQVEEAIILEDDCLPAPSFYPFCEELLARYRHDTRIMHIGGCNLQKSSIRSLDAYYFSYLNHIWGWATWRRAWAPYYDVEIKLWPLIRNDDWLAGIFADTTAIRFWHGMFDDVHSGKLDTWDVQWTFTCWTQHGLAIVPTFNLISNIGFGQLATHTTSSISPLSCLPTYTMNFPLKHPRMMMRNITADMYTQHHFFTPPQSYRRYLRSLLSRLVKYHCFCLV